MKTKLNILSLKRLCFCLSLKKDNLECLLKNFEKKCRIRTIYTNKGKERKVVITSSEIKRIQKQILNILYEIYIHDAAHGWRKGRSIKTNAQKHCGNPAKLCLDIENCFPNIHSSQIKALFQTKLGCSSLVSRYLTRLTTFNYMLPQGFVTSGAIINLLFRDMDITLSRIARKYSLVYTRYGDDITFSGQYISDVLRLRIKKIIGKFGIKLNNKKEEYTNGDSSPLVTGLNVSGKFPVVPRKYKRKLMALKHKTSHMHGYFKNKNIKTIRAKESFVQFIENK